LTKEFRVHKRSVIVSTTVAAAIAITGLGAALTARTHVPPRVIAAPSEESTWKKITLDPEFRSEGVAVADVNHDGKPDVLAGNLWYEAPNWTPHEIAPVQKLDGAKGYSSCFLSWSTDVNNDGWMDQLVVQFPGDKAVWRERACHLAERLQREPGFCGPAGEQEAGPGLPLRRKDYGLV
jgi:hypothetical protein